jgi:hypothetical protein
MPTASVVSITCQACGLTSTVPVDALLVSVAVDDHRTTTGPLDADADARVDNAGTVAWTCGGCADLTTGQLDWPALLTLVTAGVTVLDDATHEARPPDPEQPSSAAPLTRDDLLTLHELLASDTWFDQVTTAGCVNS